MSEQSQQILVDIGVAGGGCIPGPEMKILGA